MVRIFFTSLAIYEKWCPGKHQYSKSTISAIGHKTGLKSWRSSIIQSCHFNGWDYGSVFVRTTTPNPIPTHSVGRILSILQGYYEYCDCVLTIVSSILCAYLRFQLFSVISVIAVMFSILFRRMQFLWSYRRNTISRLSLGRRRSWSWSYPDCRCRPIYSTSVCTRSIASDYSSAVIKVIYRQSFRNPNFSMLSMLNQNE